MKQEEFEREIWKAYQAGKEMEAGLQRERRWQLLLIPVILLVVALNVVVRL